MSSDMVNFFAIIVFAVGIAECFFGYRLFKVFLGIAGFVAGWALANTFLGRGVDSQLVALLIGLVGGAVGAWLLVTLYQVGIFCTGAALFASLTVLLTGLLNVPCNEWALICSGILGGTLAVIFKKFVIIVSTAFSGAWNLMAAFLWFMNGDINPLDYDRVAQSFGDGLSMRLIGWLVLGIIGVTVQYQLTVDAAVGGVPGAVPAAEPDGGAQ